MGVKTQARGPDMTYIVIIFDPWGQCKITTKAAGPVALNTTLYC